MRQLNFAGAPFRNERLPWLVFGIAVTALIAITVIHAATLTRYFMREQEELDVKVASLETELNGLVAEVNRTQGELSTERDQSRNEKILFLAALYQRRRFSWTGFFNELESLTPAPVRITSIAPGGVGPIDEDVGEELEIQLQIIARTLDDVLEMLRRLEANQLYASVLPLRETEGGQRVDGVAVTLTLDYLPNKEELPVPLPTEGPDERNDDGNKVVPKPVSETGGHPSEKP